MAGITVDITGRLINAKEILDEFQKTMNKIDLNSGIGQQFKSMVDNAKELYNKSSKNVERNITNNSGISKLNAEIDNIYKRLQQAATILQTLDFSSLNTTSFSSELKGLEKNIETLKTQMNNTQDNGIRAWVESASSLKQILQDAGLSLDKLTAKNVGDVISANADKASKNLDDARKAVQQYEAEVIKLKGELQTLQAQHDQLSFGGKMSSMLGSTRKLMNRPGVENVDVNTQLLTNNLYNLKEELQKLTLNMHRDEINGVFALVKPSDITSVEQLQQALKTLRSQLLALKETNGTALFSSEQFLIRRMTNHDLSQKNAGAYFSRDDAGVDKVYDNFSKILIMGRDNGALASVTQLDTLITQIQDRTLNITDAYNAVNEAIKAGKDNLNNLINEKTTNLSEQEKFLNDASIQLTNAGITNIHAQTYKDEYETRIKNLQEQVDKYEIRITTLEEQLKEYKSGKVEEAKKPGESNLPKINQSLSESVTLAQKYQNQLDQINDKQKLVGKIEGLVQRWFSIYTVVRMVSKAINQIKATLKELDKTITEIAIVTDMTQKDLWSQMDSYTRMARQYGASISGVYKVSQLFYQQGLQTNEVMTLTEQTLKMARISGLEYADATDYMTNALRSFKMEMSEAQTIVDVYSAIAASSATSTKELAQAMSKTASSAESVGSSFENTTAMMAVMIGNTVPYNRKIILNPEYAGNSLELFLLNQYSDILAA